MTRMTHADWVNTVVTFLASLGGGIGGGLLVLFTTRSANRNARQIAQADHKEQRQLVSQEREAQSKAAEVERELERVEQRNTLAREAAARLLERLGDLDGVLLMLPRLSELNTVRYSEPVQTQVGIPFNNFRRGLRTDLLLINDQSLVDRYRALGLLADELATATFESDIVLNRATQDTAHYIKWVLICTRQFIDGQPLEPHTSPPVLRRLAGDGTNWFPSHTPADWDLI